MTEEPKPLAEKEPTARSRGFSRRLRVGVVSVGTGLICVVLLVAYRDRIKTRSAESACNGGDVDKCLEVAETYASGEGVQKDKQLAMRFQQRAVKLLSAQCFGVDAPACYRLGVLLRDWRITPDSCAVAQDAFERGCEGGIAKSCIRAGASCGKGERDGTREGVFLAKACMAGDDRMCLLVAASLKNTGHEGEAIPLLEAACQRDVGEACYAVSDLVRGRPGVDVNLERSFAYAARAVGPLEKACERNKRYWYDKDRGGAHPCAMLANLLNAGRGVKRDLNRVRDLWSIACEGKDESACEPLGDERGFKNLGIQKVELGTRAQGRHACERGEAWSCYREAFTMLREGNDVSGDPRAVGFFFARASTLFGKECERNDAEACRVVGDLRKVGLGLPRDVEGALSAYEKAGRLVGDACEKGDAESCAKLAKMYADGVAVATDPKRAVRAFDRAKSLLSAACDPSDEAAKSACDRLDRLLQDGTVVPARVRAKEH